jgi:hypothetical protein
MSVIYQSNFSWKKSSIANDCQELALKSPPDARISMNFQFCEALPIKEFIDKINICKLCTSLCNFGSLKYYFTFVGMARMGFYYDREVCIPITWYNVDKTHMEETLLKEIQKFCLYDFDSEPKISKMRIAYNDC